MFGYFILVAVIVGFLGIGFGWFMCSVFSASKESDIKTEAVNEYKSFLLKKITYSDTAYGCTTRDQARGAYIRQTAIVDMIAGREQKK